MAFDKKKLIYFPRLKSRYKIFWKHIIRQTIFKPVYLVWFSDGVVSNYNHATYDGLGK